MYREFEGYAIGIDQVHGSYTVINDDGNHNFTRFTMALRFAVRAHHGFVDGDHGYHGYAIHLLAEAIAARMAGLIAQPLIS